MSSNVSRETRTDPPPPPPSSSFSAQDTPNHIPQNLNDILNNDQPIIIPHSESLRQLYLMYSNPALEPFSIKYFRGFQKLVREWDVLLADPDHPELRKSSLQSNSDIHVHEKLVIEVPRRLLVDYYNEIKFFIQSFRTFQEIIFINTPIDLRKFMKKLSNDNHKLSETVLKFIELLNNITEEFSMAWFHEDDIPKVSSKNMSMLRDIEKYTNRIAKNVTHTTDSTESSSPHLDKLESPSSVGNGNGNVDENDNIDDDDNDNDDDVRLSKRRKSEKRPSSKRKRKTKDSQSFGSDFDSDCSIDDLLRLNKQYFEVHETQRQQISNYSEQIKSSKSDKDRIKNMLVFQKYLQQELLAQWKGSDDLTNLVLETQETSDKYKRLWHEAEFRIVQLQTEHDLEISEIMAKAKMSEHDQDHDRNDNDSERDETMTNENQQRESMESPSRNENRHDFSTFVQSDSMDSSNKDGTETLRKSGNDDVSAGSDRERHEDINTSDNDDASQSQSSIDDSASNAEKTGSDPSMNVDIEEEVRLQSEPQPYSNERINTDSQSVKVVGNNNASTPTGRPQEAANAKTDSNQQQTRFPSQGQGLPPLQPQPQVQPQVQPQAQPTAGAVPQYIIPPQFTKFNPPYPSPPTTTSNFDRKTMKGLKKSADEHVSSLKAEMDKWRFQLEEERKTSEELRSTLNKMQRDVNKDKIIKERLSVKNEFIKKELKRLKKELSVLSTDKQNFENSYNRLKDSKTRLEYELRQLQLRFESEHGQLKQYSSVEYNQLKNHLETEYAKMTERVELEHKTRRNELEQEFNEQKSNLESQLAQFRTKYESENDTLKDSNRALETEVNVFKVKMESQTEYYELQKRTLTDMNNQLEQKIKQLQTNETSSPASTRNPTPVPVQSIPQDDPKLAIEFEKLKTELEQQRKEYIQACQEISALRTAYSQQQQTWAQCETNYLYEISNLQEQLKSAHERETSILKDICQELYDNGGPHSNAQLQSMIKELADHMQTLRTGNGGGEPHQLELSLIEGLKSLTVDIPKFSESIDTLNSRLEPLKDNIEFLRTSIDTISELLRSLPEQFAPVQDISRIISKFQNDDKNAEADDGVTGDKEATSNTSTQSITNQNKSSPLHTPSPTASPLPLNSHYTSSNENSEDEETFSEDESPNFDRLLNIVLQLLNNPPLPKSVFPVIQKVIDLVDKMRHSVSSLETGAALN